MVESVVMCSCGDRPLDQCPGEWEPGCDLGANEAHVVVVPESAELDSKLSNSVEK